MNNDFNIYVFSNDANFCSSLAIECNNYGFELTFFEPDNMENVFEQNDTLISVVIIDLTCMDNIDPFELGKEARMIADFPVFGAVRKFNKKDQEEAKQKGFDLIFTKKMLLRSIRDVVIHISDNE